jgi:hypothetical protein
MCLKCLRFAHSSAPSPPPPTEQLRGRCDVAVLALPCAEVPVSAYRVAVVTYTDQFVNLRDRLESRGSPPCDHTRLDSWIDSPGDERDGYGCLSCGRWFETEADALRDAESNGRPGRGS